MFMVWLACSPGIMGSTAVSWVCAMHEALGDECGPGGETWELPPCLGVDVGPDWGQGPLVAQARPRMLATSRSLCHPGVMQRAWAGSLHCRLSLLRIRPLQTLADLHHEPQSSPGRLASPRLRYPGKSDQSPSGLGEGSTRRGGNCLVFVLDSERIVLHRDHPVLRCTCV